MSHLAQKQFCLGVKRRHPEFFSGQRVLDVGSLDINGNNRHLFDNFEYTGLDIGPGRNVDVVCRAHEYDKADGSFDVIISTEALEHDRFYAQSLRNMVRLLRPGGLLLVTCATTGRAEHGTQRHGPDDSPLTVQIDEWRDYYRNLTEADLQECLEPATWFSDYEFSVETSHHDLRFWGIKRLVSSVVSEEEQQREHTATDSRRLSLSHAGRPFIVTMIPYCPQGYGKNLGRAYNLCMERLHEEDWACFIDHDACFTTPTWYQQLESIVAECPEPCVLTAKTNRVGSPWQRVPDIDPREHSMIEHRRIGRHLADQYGTTLTDVTDQGLMSGVVILLAKKTWRQLGGFRDGFLGVDNELHQAARDQGLRVYLMEGLYVYHWYRGDGHVPHDVVDEPASLALPVNTNAAPRSVQRSEVADPADDQLAKVVEVVPRSARRILDATGDPVLTVALGERGSREVHVCDPAVMCTEKQDAETADLNDDAYDCVVVGNQLILQPEPKEFLGRVRQCLAPDGQIVGSVPNVRYRGVIQRLFEGTWCPPSGRDSADVPLRYFTRSELEKALFRVGFRAVELRPATDPSEAACHEQESTDTVRVGPLQIGGLGASQRQEFYTTEYVFSATLERRPDYPLTSIVIVTCNQLGYTRQCVNSLLEFTDPPFELLFVDNGSTDGTLEYLAALEGATVIRNAGNRGFPAAANQGVASSRGEYVLLLNNDTLVTTGWLQRLLAALQQDERLGLVGPCSNCISGPQQVPVSYSDLSCLDGFAWQWGKQHAGQLVSVDRLVGFCLLIRRSLLDELGLFDEQFGLGNFEDDDFCLRARRAGYKLAIAQDAFVHHFGSRTFAGQGVDLAALLRENETRFRQKWGQNGRTDAPPEGEDDAPADRSRPFALERRPGGGLLIVPRAVKLSLCMIVRDSARTLEACLQSIQPWVDEMVIVDTGSHDETPEIARKFGARLFHFPWCDDFAAARNESLRHARGEWLFWMDSDDTIDEENGRKLQALARQPATDSVLGYVMQVHCPGSNPEGHADVTAVDHVKLLRNRPDLRFENRIHEQVLPAIRRAEGEVAWTDIFVRHSGSDQSPEGRRRKQDRDMRLLELEQREKPDHPFVLFNIGMTYADMEQYEPAAAALARSIAIAQPDESHVRKAYALLVGCYMQLDRFDEALKICQQGCRLYPKDPELCFRHGIVLHHFGRLGDAEQSYLSALANGDERHFSSFDRGIVGYKARHNLASVYLDKNDPQRAEAQWRQVIDEIPAYRPAWRGLGDALVRQNKLAELEVVAEQLGADQSLRVEGLLLKAKFAKQTQDFSSCEHWLRQAAASDDDDLEALRQLCQLLFEHGSLADAQEALERLSTRSPADACAYHNLATIYLRRGEAERAVRVYRKSLELRPEHAASYLYLGYALRQMGQHSQAIGAWQEVLRLEPSNPAASEALRAESDTLSGVLPARANDALEHTETARLSGASTVRQCVKSLRIMYVGGFRQAWSTEQYVATALRDAGHHVSAFHEYDIRSADEMLRELRSGRFDCFLFFKGRIASNPQNLDEVLAPNCDAITEVLRQSPVPGFMWCFDRVYGFDAAPWREDWIQKVGPLCRVVFTTDGPLTQTTWANWHLLRLAIASKTVEDVSIDESGKYDVAFIGSDYGPRRTELQPVRSAFQLRMIDGVYGRGLNIALRTPRIVIGPRYPDVPGYWSDRIYLVLGHGGFFLAPEVGGMQDEGFIAGVHYAPLSNDPVQDIRYWLSRPKERQQIAEAGQALVLGRHTYVHRVKELVRVIHESL